MKKRSKKAKPLVLSHISGLSKAVIQKHQKSFRTFIGRRKSGLYVLREKRKIYYVGLSKSLPARLAYHLTDKHKRKWDEFDMYVIREGGAKYIRELEALLIRVAKPAGNENEPKFIRHNNVTKKFQRALVKEASKRAAQQVSELFLAQRR